ncbi:hypothetical protein B0H14DRAFT_3147461 [Mycena olivaceomarginata]|nr:hypothetical protein B0H14DRAFT_3147461 [Mycena olivaceomarginata]
MASIDLPATYRKGPINSHRILSPASARQILPGNRVSILLGCHFHDSLVNRLGLKTPEWQIDAKPMPVPPRSKMRTGLGVEARRLARLLNHRQFLRNRRLAPGMNQIEDFITTEVVMYLTLRTFRLAAPSRQQTQSRISVTKVTIELGKRANRPESRIVGIEQIQDFNGRQNDQYPARNRVSVVNVEENAMRRRVIELMLPVLVRKAEHTDGKEGKVEWESTATC